MYKQKEQPIYRFHDTKLCYSDTEITDNYYNQRRKSAHKRLAKEIQPLINGWKR